MRRNSKLNGLNYARSVHEFTMDSLSYDVKFSNDKEKGEFLRYMISEKKHFKNIPVFIYRYSNSHINTTMEDYLIPIVKYMKAVNTATIQSIQKAINMDDEQLLRALNVLIESNVLEYIISTGYVFVNEGCETDLIELNNDSNNNLEVERFADIDDLKNKQEDDIDSILDDILSILGDEDDILEDNEEDSIIEAIEPCEMIRRAKESIREVIAQDSYYDSADMMLHIDSKLRVEISEEEDIEEESIFLEIQTPLYSNIMQILPSDIRKEEKITLTEQILKNLADNVSEMEVRNKSELYLKVYAYRISSEECFISILKNIVERINSFLRSHCQWVFETEQKRGEKVEELLTKLSVVEYDAENDHQCNIIAKAIIKKIIGISIFISRSEALIIAHELKSLWKEKGYANKKIADILIEEFREASDDEYNTLRFRYSEINGQ